MGINFKKTGEDAQNTDFAPLPEDRYNTKISAAEVGKSKGGNTMITVTFDVISGKYTNRKLWSNFTLTDTAQVYMYALLKAIGSKMINEENVEADDIAQELIGKQCSVFATIENSNKPGQLRNKVGVFKPITSSDTEDTKSSGNLFK